MSGADQPTADKSVQEFLQRWSRRKLGIAEPEDAARSAPPEPPPAAPPAAGCPEPQSAFDVTALPPIESIDATTDIRAFMAPGVPVELTRAALRRAWTSDPAIRDFVGIAENQWDFTNPDAVPGFGSLQFSEEVRAMVSQLFGETAPAAPHQATEDRSDTPVAASIEPPVMSTDVTDRKALSTDAAATREVAGGDDAVQYAAAQNEIVTQEKPQLAKRKRGAGLPK